MASGGPQQANAILRSVLSSPVLTMNGWVAFDLPRTVTALGVSLLSGVVAVHVYLLATMPALPGYFAVYAGLLMVGCLAAAGAMIFGRTPFIPRVGWVLGSLLCMAFLTVYLATRFVAVPGLTALTDRWDVAPGTLAMALAAGFIALHTTVLSGINVAYPQRRNWRD
jgi:hypothetical protein